MSLPLRQVMPELSIRSDGQHEGHGSRRHRLAGSRFFANDRSQRNLRVGRGRPFPRRRMRHGREYCQLEPVQRPPPCFLKSGCCCGTGVNSTVNLIVGHPATTRPSMMLMQYDVASNVHAAKGAACETAHRMEPPLGPPGGQQKVVVALLLSSLASECKLPLISTSLGGTQSDHLCVEFDGDIHVVSPRRNIKVLRSETFVGGQDGVYLVDLFLDHRRRHRWRKDKDVGPKIRLGAAGCHPRSDGQHKQRRDKAQSKYSIFAAGALL